MTSVCSWRTRGVCREPLPPWHQRPGHYLFLHAGGHHHARHYSGVRAGCKWHWHTRTKMCVESFCVIYNVSCHRKSTGRNISPKPNTASSTSQASSALSTYSPSAGARASCSLYVRWPNCRSLLYSTMLMIVTEMLQCSQENFLSSPVTLWEDYPHTLMP